VEVFLGRTLVDRIPGGINGTAASITRIELGVIPRIYGSFISQTIFLSVLQTSMPENQTMDITLLTGLLMSLSMDQKITIFTGGDIFVEAIDMSLHFEEQNDSSVIETVYWLLANKTAPADQRAVLLTLVSNDLDTTSPEPTAKAANILFMKVEKRCDPGYRLENPGSSNVSFRGILETFQRLHK